jgi:aspartyl-tRNA(Asn)/glutamyl-tRNA(Gln) amidotransferase subunit A
MTGTFVLSQGYYDAYYTKAQKVRRLIQDRTNEILSQNDLILLPTTPTTAFEINAVKDNIQMYLQDIFTVQANLSGNPAISLPIGQHPNGMPYGLQLIGKNFKEKELIDASAFLMDFC